jgi:hypothetical protein
MKQIELINKFEFSIGCIELKLIYYLLIMGSSLDLKIVILVDLKDHLVLYVLENFLRIIPN